jgi:hypothetical protein
MDSFVVSHDTFHSAHNFLFSIGKRLVMSSTAALRKIVKADSAKLEEAQSSALSLLDYFFEDVPRE